MDWFSGWLFYQKGECEWKLRNYKAARDDLLTAKHQFQKEWMDVPEEDKQANHWGDPKREHQDMMEHLENKIAIVSYQLERSRNQKDQ